MNIQEAGDQETMQIGSYSQNFENQVQKSIDFFDFNGSPIKMPPVHQSSLVPEGQKLNSKRAP